MVVNVLIPFSQARKVASIRSTLDAYRQLQPTAGHIRGAYLLELLLAFSVVLMLALWMGFRLAKGVTGPIRALAEGTAEVARGNLDVSVQATSDDEVGFLVGSFNQMIRDLRDARSGLERSATELERRRRYMEIVLGTVGAGVVSVDAEGRISTINPSAQRFLGIPAGTGLLGQKLADVVHRPELIEVIEELVGALRPGVRESIRRQVQVPIDDDVATLFVTLTVMHDEAGEALGTVVVFDDYTQLVKVQRMAAWREVARRIAHEIKNPLTPIQLSAQRLRRRFAEQFAGNPEDAKVFDECVDAITSQVDALKLLVDEFQNFARLPAAQPRPGDLNRIVAEAIASYAGTDDVEFDTELDPDLPTVDFDREQMRRALTNLIDNAVAAVQRRLELGGDRAPGRVALRSAPRPAAAERAHRGRRRRHRHPAAGPPARLRALLLDEGARHRARPRDRVADRRRPPRLRPRAAEPAARRALRGRAARAARRGRAQRHFGDHGRGAAPERLVERGSWSSTTRRASGARWRASCPTRASTARGRATATRRSPRSRATAFPTSCCSTSRCRAATASRSWSSCASAGRRCRS